MRLTRVLFWLFIFVLAGLLAVSAGCGVRASVRPPRVDEGAEWLRVVTLDPLGLTIKRGGAAWSVCNGFELRVLDEGGVKSLLVRGTLFVRGAEFGADAEGRVYESRPPQYEYSDSTYAVALDGSFRTRKIGAGEWARARELTDEERGVGHAYPATRKFYRDGEGTLPEGGATRGGLPLTRLEVGGAEPSNSGWLLSQEGKYVAAFSHTSRRRAYKRPNLIPFLGGEDDRIAGGTMYVDVFDGAAGRRLARASRGHRGSSEFYVFEEAVWFEGRYFAMPLDSTLGAWLVGAFPD